jgi:Flp pilus assembly protein CpaB
MDRLALTYRRVRRAVLARRRPIAALCAALAVATALQANAAPPPPTRTVLVAARDIPAGVPVRAGDLTTHEFAPDSVPHGTVSAPAALGRTTVGPVRRGEPLTDVRLLRASLLDGYPGLVAVPVRIGDPAAVALLRVGDKVDVLAADPRAGTARVLVTDAPVVAVPHGRDDAADLTTGALVVLAVSDEAARSVAAAGVSAVLSVVLTG